MSCWLAKLGYVDFAGSSVIHMVGGIASVIGAAMLGPRIGKYIKGKDGKTVVNALPGHSLTPNGRILGNSKTRNVL